MPLGALKIFRGHDATLSIDKPNRYPRVINCTIINKNRDIYSLH